MNLIDLLVCLALAVAVWNGWRRGFILQICSLAALVAAIWLAARFGGAVGQRLGIESAYAPAAGFATVLVVVVLAVSILGRLVRGLFRFAGFGPLDTVLGIVVSILKWLLLLGALCAAVDRFDADRQLVSAETIETSVAWRPLRNLSHSLVPFVERIAEEAERYRTEAPSN